MTAVDLCDPIATLYFTEEDPMPHTWTARYYSACENCDTKVSPGQEVVWIGDPEDRVIAHAICPDAEPDLSAPYGVCNVCFLALPASRLCGSC